MKRLFIAINLPEEIRKRIREIVGQIIPLLDVSTRLSTGGDIRFLKPETWHITITFLGYQPDDAMPVIIESLGSAAQNHSNILKNIRIIFDRISFGPLGKQPRMIWLVATNETSKNLALLKDKLEDELVKNNVRFQREERGLGAAHITLARFRVGEAQLKEKLSLPRIQDMFFTAESFDLMESHLKRTGAEYEILNKIDFKKTI